MRDINDAVSNERLEELANGDMEVWYSESQSMARELLALREKTKQCEQLAAENAVQREFIATCFHAAGDGGDMDGADIQALGERLGLFGREAYQPVIHGYICGHEPGEDSVYVMNKTPATDAFLREVRAQTITSALDSLDGVFDTDCVMETNGVSYEEAEQRTTGALAVNSALIEFAAQLRQGGAA